MCVASIERNPKVVGGVQKVVGIASEAIQSIIIRDYIISPYSIRSSKRWRLVELVELPIEHKIDPICVINLN